MKQNFTVLGARRFNDTVEGTKYDFTKLRVVMDAPEGDNSIGLDAVDLPWGTHENFAQIATTKWPATFELDYKITTKGIEVKDAKFIKDNVTL